MNTNDEIMMQFIDMTGSEPETALYFLEMSNFDLEKALNLMFSGDIPPPSSSSNVVTQSQSTIPHTDSFPSYDDDDSQENVRMADPVRQQVLLDVPSLSHLEAQGNHSARANFVLSRAEDAAVEWMFPPPSHLSFPGTLAEARSLAKTEQKWILVNIQCDKEFSSHMLNRDVWTNETLVSLLRMNFVFWQRGTTSQDGQMFSSMHRLSPEVGGAGFPMIGVVVSAVHCIALHCNASLIVSLLWFRTPARVLLFPPSLLPSQRAPTI